MANRVLLTVASVLTVFALSGCLKMDADIEVHEDATVSGEMTMAMSKEMVKMLDSLAEEFGGDDAQESDDDADEADGEFFDSDEIPAGARVEPYEDDRFIGQKMTFSKITVDELNQSAETGDDTDESDWTLVRQGDEFIFESVADFGSEDAAEASADEMDLGFDKLLEDSEIRISVTFPGEVVEATGEIDGNTVVWTPQFGEKVTLRAVAKAEGGTNWLLVAGAGVGVLVLLGVALLFAMRRKGTPPTAPGTPAADSL